jgi:hypothetical protein
MVVKALKSYLDKVAKAVVPAGALLDMDEGRVKELNSAPGAPYVEAFSGEAKSTAAKKR